jgi:transcriptional regulator with XRE-family HTH domain
MLTPAQIRMARAALRIGVRELAEMASVAAMTLSRIETGLSSGTGTTLGRIERALTTAGVVFIAENGGGPGVRLKKGHKATETIAGERPRGTAKTTARAAKSHQRPSGRRGKR